MPLRALPWSAATAATAAPGQNGATGPLSGRRGDLDLMRAFVVVGLVAFHSAMVFAPGTDWFVTDPHSSAGFSVLLLWGSLWGMPLLFVVSGMGVRYALRRRSAGAFVRERLTRLLVPFVTGLVLLVPPMFYVARLSQPGFREPYWRFWLDFMNVPSMAATLLPRGSWTSGTQEFDPAHLWFLYVLLVLTLVLLPAFVFLRGPRGARVLGRLAGAAERRPLLALAVAAVPVMAVETAFGPDVNTGGWERVSYLFPLLYGFLLASDDRFSTVLQRGRRWALAVAVVATGALLAWTASVVSFGSSLPAGWGALQGLAGWAWLAAILGFGSALRGRSVVRPAPTAPARARWWPRAAAYANEAVLPFYLLHEPIIVLVAWYVVRWQLPDLAKYLVLVAASLTITVGLYELLVRRSRVTRLLFGMKLVRQAPGATHGSPAAAAASDNRLS